MRKVALIFGVTGQDGSYLAELLLKKGYNVHGVKRRTSVINTERIDHIFDSVNFNNRYFSLHHGDLSDSGSLYRIINKVNPDEIYNLAAQSHVKISFQIPEYTSDVNALGTLRAAIILFLKYSISSIASLFDNPGKVSISVPLSPPRTGKK